MKYIALCGNTTRIISGCNTAKEALQVAIKAYNDCLDHTDNIEIYDTDNNYLLSEDEGEDAE